MWKITSPEEMADPTSAASIIAATGRYDNDFVKSYTRFRLLLQKSTVGIFCHLIHIAGYLEDNELIVLYMH